MNYREQPAPLQLRHLASCLWTVQTCEPIPDFSVRPDGCVDVIFGSDGKLHVAGAMTGPMRFQLAAGSISTGIRFLPGAAFSLLGVPAHELVDQTIPLDDLGARTAVHDLEERLAEAGQESRSRLLSEHFENRPSHSSPMQKAIAQLTASSGLCDLARLADQAGLSARQFRRRCLEESGLTPGLLARILRFQHALTRAARRRPETWTNIAAHCGYFDQAHLIRDFHQFAGASPMSVLSKARALFAG